MKRFTGITITMEVSPEDVLRVIRQNNEYDEIMTMADLENVDQPTFESAMGDYFLQIVDYGWQPEFERW